MIFTVLLLSLTAISWFVYFVFNRRLPLLEASVYSVGMAIILPTLLLILLATISLPIDTSSILISAYVSMLTPFIAHISSSFRKGLEQSNGIPTRVPLEYKQIFANAKPTISVALGILLLTSSFVILSLKWAHAAGGNSFINIGTDVSRIATVTQVIAATGGVPPIDYIIHVDTGTTATAGLPFIQVFESIPTIIDNAGIADVVNYTSLLMILFGAFFIFAIVHNMTRKYEIAGLASLLFAAALAYMHPNNSNFAVYFIFPLIYAATRYIQSGRKDVLVPLFVFAAALFLTHHGTALFGIIVFLLITIVAFIAGTKVIRERATHVALVVTLWFGIVAAVYMILFKVPFDYFLRFYTAYWQFTALANSEAFRFIIIGIYAATLLSPLIIYLVYSRFSFLQGSDRLHRFTSKNKTVLRVIKNVSLSAVIGFVIILLSISIYTNAPVGQDFLFELTRNANIAFLPVTIAALSFLYVRKEKLENIHWIVMIPYFIPFFIGIISSSISLSTTGDTIGRLVPFTHPILAAFAALAIMVFVFSRRKRIQLASVGLTASLIIFATVWSFGAIDKMYQESQYQDYIMGIQDFKTNYYNHEVVVYDFVYINTFMRLEPDIFISKATFPSHDEMAAFLKDRRVSYVIATQSEEYWNNVLESRLQYQIVMQSPNLTIYRIIG